MFRKMRYQAAVFCLLVVTACSAKSPATPSPIARDVVLTPGQAVSVSEADATLRFDGVSGDSRCPIDAICIQGGDALVHIAVLRPRHGTQSYTLHTGNLRPVVHDDLTIALVDLTPYPYSARPIQPSDYRLTLRISR